MRCDQQKKLNQKDRDSMALWKSARSTLLGCGGPIKLQEPHQKRTRLNIGFNSQAGKSHKVERNYFVTARPIRQRPPREAATALSENRKLDPRPGTTVQSHPLLDLVRDGYRSQKSMSN